MDLKCHKCLADIPLQRCGVHKLVQKQVCKIYLDEEQVQAGAESRVKVLDTDGHLKIEVAYSLTSIHLTCSLPVYSLAVTISGSLSSPRACRLERWLETRGERQARLEER